jgi:3D (Asp-Asp-Asp) domain-containing protein
MDFYKHGLLKKTFSFLLLSSMLVAATGTMVSNVKAASMVACTVGVACTTGGGTTVGGGALTAATNPTVINNGTALTVTGQDQIIPFKFLTTLNDARGTGIGWSITAAATAMDFTTAQSDLFLDTAVPVTVTCSGNSTCSSPAALTLIAGGGDLTTAPIQLVDAPAATGLGAYNITTTGNFALPASASSGAATGGVISVTIAAAP